MNLIEIVYTIVIGLAVFMTIIMIFSYVGFRVKNKNNPSSKKTKSTPSVGKLNIEYRTISEGIKEKKEISKSDSTEKHKISERNFARDNSQRKKKKTHSKSDSNRIKRITALSASAKDFEEPKGFSPQKRSAKFKTNPPQKKSLKEDNLLNNYDDDFDSKLKSMIINNDE